jgi:hypothetical protein
VLEMSTLAPIADKLGKFIRLLSSDRDGEVVAAARAISRTLQGAKLDIHALADGLVNGKKFSEADAMEIYQRGVADGRRAAEKVRPASFHNVSDDDGPPWHEIACECSHSNRLRDQREKDFVNDMVRWTVRGGVPTEKQAKWLRSIYVRVRQ